MRRLSLLAGLLLLPLLAIAEPIHLVYLYSDGNIPGTLKAYQSLLAERPDLQGKVKLSVLTESVFDSTKPADILGADVLVFDTMNEQLLSRFNSSNKTDLIKSVRQRGTVLGVGEGLLGEENYTKQGVVWDPRARDYWTHSGALNQLSLMKLALAKAGVGGLKTAAPQPSLDFGYYYPDSSGGKVFATWQEFDSWRTAHGKHRPGALRVAVSFFKASYYSGDTGLLEAIVAEIERRGAEAIPVFGYPGAVSVERLLMDESGKSRADVVLGSNFNFSDSDAAKIVARVGVPVINLITLYGRSETEWRASSTGLSMFEGTFNLAVPEFAGTIAPTVVASKEKKHDPISGVDSVITQPIPAQITSAVGRAVRVAALRTKPNAEKHIALLYYNFPPGKASIGASYLNVAESLANVLARLAAQGYDLGGPAPDAARVLEDITRRARNIGSHAPGDLQEFLKGSGAIRVPLAEYRKWLGEYPALLRDRINKDWGMAEKSRLMTEQASGNTNFIIPAVQYGKILLTPQPARAWGEDLEKLYHAKNLAPHHQYVAAYAWLRNGYKADAIVHVGTHGTLEWLDGKDVGLSSADAPDALIADLPNIYLYNVDVVGEGLVARRRSEAALVDHMVPPFRKGGLTQDLAALGELMNDQSTNETKNPELAAAFSKKIQQRAMQLGVAKDLHLPADTPWTEAQLHQIEDYLLDLKGQNIPYGLHAFGRTPDPAARASTVAAIVAADRSLLPEKQKVLSKDMDARILASGPRELDNLMLALSGRALPSGTGGEPIRNPDSYPTGNNFYGIDPDKVPKPASWDLGVTLAKQMLADHLKEHGKYPEKVSFVIWGDETMRHEGVLESQIFYLLGTRPVWSDRGKVIGVEVIPRAQLGRPRIDIVIASAAEGMFNNVTVLMDQAVQKVKAIDEAENLVRKHYLATRAALISKGHSAAEADKLAGVRIFDEPPGSYNLNTSTIVASSGSWDSDLGFANDYIRKMGHGYGNGYWGESMEDVFRLALAGTDKVVHSSSTALYGALDNDDMFMYMGGLAAAVRSVDGKTPDMVVTNTRDPGKPEMTRLDKFVGKEFRSRYVNPTWIAGMKKEGYAGAGEMRAFVEYLWGWDATVSSVVDDAMWQETFAVYVQDKYHLDLKQFFETSSPFAYQDMTARMIETVRKQYWKPDQATRDKLLHEYIDSVAKHGVNCTENSCGNPRLLQYVLEQGKAAGVPSPVLDKVQQAFEKAMGESVAQASQRLRAFASSNDAREKAESGPAGAGQESLKGYLMKQESRSKQNDSSGSARAEGTPWAALWWAVPVLALLLLWRWRRSRNSG